MVIARVRLRVAERRRGEASFLGRDDLYVLLLHRLRSISALIRMKDRPFCFRVKATSRKGGPVHRGQQHAANAAVAPSRMQVLGRQPRP
jgi:hypothetical protein